jgi:CheY-like chemotaxis protein
MKKPLILLVDDDRAVLDALEAELRPAFEEIARIEAFDDPRAVLDALPDWAAEDRAIAVAIVDQKMPERTGVELLVRLRELAHAATAAGATFHPAAHLRAVLLTGYAELDAAVAAKNEAGVDRYVEKPWHPNALAASARGCLGAYLADSGADRHFRFRPVATVEELLDHWRLRYSAYATTSATRHFEADRGEDLDVDEHDKQSDLWSLFECALSSGHAVGTMRYSWPCERPQADLVRMALLGHPALIPRAEAPPAHELPMGNYLPDWPVVQQLIRDAAARGERAMEGGRLTLSASLRGGRGGLRLARHAIESSVGHAVFVEKLENSLLSCTADHARMYQGYGFRECEGTATRHDDRFGTAICCLHLRPEWLASETRPATAARAARFQRTGSICQCASYPTCLAASGAAPSPYETGEFRGTDLFCPLRARELLQATHVQGDAREPTAPQPGLAA